MHILILPLYTASLCKIVIGSESTSVIKTPISKVNRMKAEWKLYIQSG